MSMIGRMGPFLTRAAAAVYATWSTTDKAASFSLSALNTVVAMTPTVGQIRGTVGKSSGKWYWELVVGVTVVGPSIGIATSTSSLNNYTGQDATSWCYYGSNGQKYTGAAGSTYGSAYAVGDVIGVALDMTAGTVTFYKNNVSQGVAFTGLTGTIYPAVGQSGANFPTVTARFDPSQFTYTPPAGHSALA